MINNSSTWAIIQLTVGTCRIRLQPQLLYRCWSIEKEAVTQWLSLLCCCFKMQEDTWFGSQLDLGSYCVDFQQSKNLNVWFESLNWTELWEWIFWYKYGWIVNETLQWSYLQRCMLVINRELCFARIHIENKWLWPVLLIILVATSVSVRQAAILQHGVLDKLN